MIYYISVEAAVNAVLNVPKGNWSNARYAHELQAVPAADVAPVGHSEWILTTTRCNIDEPEYFTWNCSHCGYRRKRGRIGVDNDGKPKGLYCERCGFKMDGGEKDATVD